MWSKRKVSHCSSSNNRISLARRQQRAAHKTREEVGPGYRNIFSTLHLCFRWAQLVCSGSHIVAWWLITFRRLTKRQHIKKFRRRLFFRRWWSFNDVVKMNVMFSHLESINWLPSNIQHLRLCRQFTQSRTSCICVRHWLRNFTPSNSELDSIDNRSINARHIIESENSTLKFMSRRRESEHAVNEIFLWNLHWNGTLCTFHMFRKQKRRFLFG